MGIIAKFIISMANNFSIGGIKIFSTAGTIFASLVGGPLLIFIITRFTLGGNKDAIPYADTYIKNSDTIVVKIPKDRHKLKRMMISLLPADGLWE